MLSLRFLVLCLVCGVIAAVAVPVRADPLTDGEFKDVRKQARGLMKRQGVIAGKRAAIQRLGQDDSARAAEVLVDWMKTSLKFQGGPLADELADRKKAFDGVVKSLSKAYATVPPTEKRADGQIVTKWGTAKHKNAYTAVKEPYDRALDDYNAEEEVRYEIGLALDTFRDEAAVRWLMTDGVKTLRKAKPPELAVSVIARTLAHQPEPLVGDVMIGFAGEAKLPRARILALGYIGDRQIAAGADAALAALKAKETAVKRAAVAALVGLDDPRCVKPLIDAMGKSSGVLTVDIEDALHHFIGLSMAGSHQAWMAWWKNEGAAWVANKEQARHGKTEKARKDDGYGFYGIETESQRIVFVLDRSGSMKTPADPASKKTRPEEGKPAPAVTGPGAVKPGGRDRGPPEVVAGDTKIEVAKNQLKWSIRQLPKDVLFGVVFYSTDVAVWRDPPEMLAASPANKKKAIGWMEPIEAKGSTSLFDALMKGLEYAATLERKPNTRNAGADTIFLLTDGSPTDKHDGLRLLTAGEITEAMQRFHEANRVYRCVVHTVGIGKEHNAPLLQRIASETGGTYRRAGE